MPTTANGFTYPAATATPDVPRDIQQLTTDLESKFGSVLAAPTSYTPTLTNVTGGTVLGRHWRIGKIGFIDIEITAGTATAVAAITASLPAGWTADATVGSAIAALRNTTTVSARVLPGGTVVNVTQADGTGFPASPALTSLRITGMVFLA